MILSILLLFAVSCNKKNVCEDNCQNGYCSDGDCVCDSGYGGKWCADNLSNTPGNTGNKGTVTFWTNFEGPPIRVSVDSIYRGQIDKYFSSEPNCNTTGTVNVDLTYGTYSYYAVQDSTGIAWSNTFSISVPCVTYRLTK